VQAGTILFFQQLLPTVVVVAVDLLVEAPLLQVVGLVEGLVTVVTPVEQETRHLQAHLKEAMAVQLAQTVVALVVVALVPLEVAHQAQQVVMVVQAQPRLFQAHL
jgi:hypothetical protein